MLFLPQRGFVQQDIAPDSLKPAGELNDDVADESINKILALSGLTMQVDQLPGLIEAGMEQAKQQGTSIPDAEYNSIVNSVEQSILPSEIIDEIRVS